MKKYIVTQDWHFMGKFYHPNDEIELSDQSAKDYANMIQLKDEPKKV